MFAQLIKDNQERLKKLSFKKRNYVFYDEILRLNKIVSFVGPRRVGKTYLMLQFLSNIIEKGFYNIDQVVFIDFSIFAGEQIDATEIIKSYYSLGNTKEPIFVFDELQDIPNFKKLVLQIYTQGYRLFISGSNSKLLSSELVTEFRGRVYEYFVYPLDFFEILDWNEIQNEAKYSSNKIGEIKSIFENVLKYGSFPELVLSKNDMVKNDLLKTYFDIVFYKDLVERYNIDNEKAIKYLIKSIILGNTKKINLIKIYNDLKSQGVKIGKNTIYNYYEYLKNIFFVSNIENFYKKDLKTYLYNFGFGSLFGYTDNKGQNFENFIYLNLLRKYDKVYYKSNGFEIDIYIKDINTNIQICYELNLNNFDREIKPLLKQDGNKIIVYFHKNGNFEYKLVKVMDFIEFFKNV